MATYKQPCIHCGTLIERDSRLCSKCASRSPFGYRCPSCLKQIARGNLVCSGCGRNLMVVCPLCNGQTFVGNEKCDTCGKSVMIRCESNRCNNLQFFENTKCTVCGKPIKNTKKQNEKMKKGEMI
jgi:RNA polymerase subunit RPABC4/transcription elongation factor Spt4